MRRLAAELDVGAMTLYGYFRTKDELLDAAVDLASDEIAIPPTDGPWREQMRALVTEILRVLRRYPVAHQVRAGRPLISPGALRSTEAGMEILLGAGFSNAEAARAWRLLFTYVFGFAAFTPPELSLESRLELGAKLAALSPDRLPRVADAAGEAVAAMGGDETFSYGLERILAGLEASRTDERSSWRP